MSWPSVYVSTSLTSGMSAALILTTSMSYTLARGAAVRWGQTTNDAQTAYLNSLEDFCLWAPSQPDLDPSALRNTELTLTAWCVKGTHGARLVPDGTISRAHFVKTPEYIQITGVGNLTNINAPADDVVSATGESNHVPGLVFTSAYGQLEQIYDWMSFVSQERFCFRAYNPSAMTSTARSQIYDISGCTENVRDEQVVEDCTGDTAHAPCNTQQQVLTAPLCDSAFVPSSCTTRRAIGGERAARVRRATVSTSGSSIPLASSTATSTNVTTIAFPSSSTLQSNATASATSTSAPTHTFNRTHGHPLVHSHSHGRSHHHFTTSPAPVLLSSSHSPTHSSSSFLFSDPPLISSVPSSTPASSHFTPDPSFSVTSSVTSTSTPIPTPTPTPTPTHSSPSFYGTSSSLSDFAQPWSYSSPSDPTSTMTPTLASSTILTFTSPSTLSPSSDTPTFTPSISPSSDPTSPSTSLPIVANSATQLGSQCPPISQDVVDAGSTTSAPSLCVICMILMVIISSVSIL